MDDTLLKIPKVNDSIVSDETLHDPIIEKQVLA